MTEERGRRVAAGRQTSPLASRAPLMVGREKEQAILRRLWADVEPRGATVAFVEGPAGFGKTSLLRDFVASVAPSKVLYAACESDEATVAFGMLAQLLRGSAAPLPPVLDQLVSGDAAGLDPILAGAALLELLGAGSRRVIAVDDVQWADPPSVRALVFALRRLRSDPVLAVLCCREGELELSPSGLRRLVHEVAVGLELPGLHADDVLAIAEDQGRTVPSAAMAWRIVDHCGGSPLYVRALLEEFRASDLDGDPDLPLPAPRTYADLVAARLAGCGESGLALVEAAAIVGDGAALPVLARLGLVADPALGLDQAIGAGLLLAPMFDSGVCFDHPLTRSAVFHAIPSARRAQLHRAAARLLAPTDIAGSLRHRVAAAGAFDPELARDVAAQGGADAASGSWSLAAERFRIAAALSEPGSDLMRRFTLRMVECLALGGEPTEISAAQATIVGFNPSPLREYAMGRLHALSGAWTVARDCLQSAWSMVDPVSDPELAGRICAELGRVDILHGRGADATNWISRALELQPDEGAPRSDTMALWAVAAGIQGQAAEVLAAMAGASTAAPEPVRQRLDRVAGRGVLSLWNGDVMRAASDLSTVMAATRGRGPALTYLFAAQYLADAAYRMGDWDTAIVTAEEAAATARDLGNVWTLPMLHAVASYPHAARGNFDEAAEHVAAATEAGGFTGNVASTLWTVVASARLAYARRDFDSVVSALEPMGELTQFDGVREPGIQPWQPMLASALIGLGRFEQAGVVLGEAELLATRRNHPVQQLAALRERAKLHAATGDTHAAVALVTTAEAVYTSIDRRPFERAQFDLVAGTVLRQAGLHDDAVAALTRAHAVLLALRAAPWLKEVTVELSWCGARTVDNDLGALCALTPHEILIAKLVADGLTNRQIAAERVVSVKTVGYHLGNIYTKLGIRSRVQLTNLVLRASGDPLTSGTVKQT